MEKLDYYLDSENNEYTANQVIDSTEFINSVNGSVNEFDSDLANSNLIEYVQKITSQQFYNENQELESYDVNTEEVIENIVLIFHHLYSNSKFLNLIEEYELESIFDKHFEIINNPENYPSFKYLYNPGYFNQFRSRLLEFRAYVTAFSSNTTKSVFMTYLIGLFNEDVLMYLEYQDKLNLLKDFYTTNKDIIFGYIISGRWHIGNDYKLTEEQVVVKLIKSIIKVDHNGIVLNIDDVNDFMDRLQSPIWWDTANKKSLYELFYTTIDPDIVFGSAGERGELVKAIYALWKVSKYNPKSNSPNLVSYNYTNYHARWKYEDDNEPNQIDKTAATLIIPYQSEKNWLWYDTNFKFKFEDKKIKAFIDDGIDYASVLPLNLIDNDHGFDDYGYYYPFQPINLTKFNSETIVQIPVDLSQFDQDNLPTTPCDLEDGRGSNLPIFYLKFADDMARRATAEETTILAIDILSIAVGGWGIYRRIIAEGGKIAIRKVFTNPSLWENLATGAKSTITRSLSSVGILNAFEFISGVLSVAHNIAEGNCTQYNDCDNNPPQPGDTTYDDYQRCQAIQKWLFAVEILSLSADAFAKRFFKNATRELSSTLPTRQPGANNPYHNPDSPNHVTDTQYDNFKQNGDDLAQGYIDELPQLLAELDSAIVQRLGDLNLSDQKKLEFIYDFQNRPYALQEILNDLDLIDEWALVRNRYARKNIGFLKKCKNFTNSINGWNHIRKGETKIPINTVPNSLPPGKTFVASGFPNIIKHDTSGIHTLHPPIPPEVIVVSTKPPNAKGYYKAKVRTKVGGGWENPTLTDETRYFAKAKESTMFPDDWDFQKIKEEYAFALTLRNAQYKVSGFGNHNFESILTDGTVCIISETPQGELVSFYAILE